MKNAKKPSLRDLKSLSYDEMRTIKGGYSGATCDWMPACPHGCGSGGLCNTCCIA